MRLFLAVLMSVLTFASLAIATPPSRSKTSQSTVVKSADHMDLVQVADNSDEADIARVVLARYALPMETRVFVRDALDDAGFYKDLKDMVSGHPSVTDDIVAKLIPNDPQRSKVFPILTNCPGYVFARKSEVTGSMQGDWREFDKHYPNADGYLRMTMPVLNRSKNVAVVYFLDWIPGTGSNSEAYVLAKVHGQWVIQDDDMGFIS